MGYCALLARNNTCDWSATQESYLAPARALANTTPCRRCAHPRRANALRAAPDFCRRLHKQPPPHWWTDNRHGLQKSSDNDWLAWNTLREYQWPATTIQIFERNMTLVRILDFQHFRLAPLPPFLNPAEGFACIKFVQAIFKRSQFFLHFYLLLLEMNRTPSKEERPFWSPGRRFWQDISPLVDYTTFRRSQSRKAICYLSLYH